MAKTPIKIAYIAGTGKSGSTLLGKLLGQVEGFADVGELINIDAQFRKDDACGCGQPVKQCPFWVEVVADSIGDIRSLDLTRWGRLKTRFLPLLLIPGARGYLRRYFSQLRDLQMAVATEAEARVIVDSSKSAFYGAVLSLFEEFEVCTIHLVRDVRGSEGSMHRLKTDGVGKWAHRGTWWNSVRWMIVNLLTERSASALGSRYVRVRYEDLVAHPARVLRQICDVLGEPSADLGFIDGNLAQLEQTHTIAGSSVRFKEGAMELKRDERWKESLPERNQAIVDGLTRRFRRRYGY